MPGGPQNTGWREYLNPGRPAVYPEKTTLPGYGQVTELEPGAYAQGNKIIFKEPGSEVVEPLRVVQPPETTTVPVYPTPNYDGNDLAIDLNEHMGLPITNIEGVYIETGPGGMAGADDEGW